MAKKLVRQFRTQAAPAGARGYRVLGGNEAVIQNPTQAGTAYTGKTSDDQGLKEHAAGAGGLLKVDPTVGSSGQNYTLGQLLYQQRLAEANQPPPLPQPSTNVPQAVDPRDFGYVPPPQPPQLPPAMAVPQIQPPTPMPPQVVMPPQPVDLSRIPNLPPLVPAYEQPNVGVDITPEIYTLPPQQRIIHERPPVIDYGPVTTPIERPTPVEISNIEPEQPYPFTPGPQVVGSDLGRLDQPQPVETAYADPIQIEPQAQQPTDIPPDEITELIDNIIPIETLEAKTLDISPTETTQPQPQPTPDKLSLWREPPKFFGEGVLGGAEEQATGGIDVYGGQELKVGDETYYRSPYTDTRDQGRSWFDVLEEGYAPSPTHTFDPADSTPPFAGGGTPTTDPSRLFSPDTRLTERPITQAPELPMPDVPTPTPTGGARAEDEFFMEDYHRETAQEPQGSGRDFGTPDQELTADPNAAVIAEILEEGTPSGGPAVTTDVAGDVDTGYPGADKPLPTYDRGVPPVPEEVVVEESADQTTPYGPDEGGLPQKPEAGVTQPPVGGRKWLHTGPQDFAETRWQLFGAGQGDPVITDTPSVVGPQVNRETGEISTQPLTWWANQPAGSSVSPYGKDVGTGTTTTDDTGTTMGGGALGTGFTAEQVTEMAGGSITPVLDQLHPGATSDGQTVIFGDVGNYDDWVDGVLDLRPDLKGIDDLGYEKRDVEGNRVGWGNHALDGFNQLTGTINEVFNFMGDPSREFTAAVLEDFGMKPTEGSNLEKMASNFNRFRKEVGQMWETSQDKAWGRKWNDLTKTQEYGDMQPLGIFALLTNPPAALGMTANSLLYDIKNAAAGMFKDNPNYEGNMAQDVLNGAFHFLGKAAKSVGSLFGKLGKAVGGKLNFTSKDMKNDPMEVSRQLLYASKNADPAVGDIRYNLVKTLLEGGVDVRFHNNAITFDKGIAKARIADIKKGISDMGLDASMIEIMAGTEGLDEFPELKAWLEARAKQIKEAAQS